MARDMTWKLALLLSLCIAWLCGCSRQNYPSMDIGPLNPSIVELSSQLPLETVTEYILTSEDDDNFCKSGGSTELAGYRRDGEFDGKCFRPTRTKIWNDCWLRSGHDLTVLSFPLQIAYHGAFDQHLLDWRISGIGQHYVSDKHMREGLVDDFYPHETRVPAYLKLSNPTRFTNGVSRSGRCLSVDVQSVSDQKNRAPAYSCGRDRKDRHDPLRESILPELKVISAGYRLRDIILGIAVYICGLFVVHFVLGRRLGSRINVGNGNDGDERNGER